MAQTRAVINLSAFEHNLALIKAWAPASQILAMIKADAYGHGATALLHSLADTAGAVGIARLSEAQALREAGFNGRIVLMAGVADANEAQAAAQLKCDLLIHNAQQIELLAANHATHVWLKLDSGMHRLGFSASDYLLAFKALQQLPQVQSITALQHFACADALEPVADTSDYNAKQLAQFDAVMTQLPQTIAQTCANSAAIMSLPNALRDWVRPGIALYGVSPFALPSGNAVIDERCRELRPVMTLQAQMLAVRDVEAGDSTGYNRRWLAEKPSRLAYIACGYADGYPITATNQTCAWVNGKRAPIVGRVSMDTLAVDITEITTPVQMGDYVELWGEHIAAAEVALAAGTIAYELFTSVSARVPRIYTRDA